MDDGDDALGSRLLGQIEEVTLDEILTHLRSAIDPSPPAPRRLKQTHIPPLDALAAAHLRDTQSPAVSLCGRPLPLVYKIISTLVSPPHRKALFVLDLEGRFDAAALDCDPGDLAHVYVLRRPLLGDPGEVRRVVAGAEDFMLYGEAARGSRRREWWGSVVVGGAAPGGDVTAGWRGWLRVERRGGGFPRGVSSLEEALGRREEEGRGRWVASSEWGAFEFAEGREEEA